MGDINNTRSLRPASHCCAWCGRPAPEVKRMDASGRQHWLHRECDRKHREFLAQPNVVSFNSK